MKQEILSTEDKWRPVDEILADIEVKQENNPEYTLNDIEAYIRYHFGD